MLTLAEAKKERDLYFSNDLIQGRTKSFNYENGNLLRGIMYVYIIFMLKTARILRTDSLT